VQVTGVIAFAREAGTRPRPPKAPARNRAPPPQGCSSACITELRLLAMGKSTVARPLAWGGRLTPVRHRNRLPASSALRERRLGHKKQRVSQDRCASGALSNAVTSVLTTSANADVTRLEILKRQYSERRRLVESDLMREVAFIRDIESKLQRLHLQRGGELDDVHDNQREDGDGVEDDDAAEDDGSHFEHSDIMQPASNTAAATQPAALAPDQPQGEHGGWAPAYPGARLTPQRPISPVVLVRPLVNGAISRSTAQRRRSRWSTLCLSRQGATQAPLPRQPSRSSVPTLGGACQGPSTVRVPIDAPASVDAPAVQGGGHGDPPVLNPDHVELRQLSVEEIGKVLRNNNLGLYEEEFGKNCVDGETLAVRR
jgi:hypothetical protein